jgi:hypothetical protein
MPSPRQLNDYSDCHPWSGLAAAQPPREQKCSEEPISFKRPAFLLCTNWEKIRHLDSGTNFGARLLGCPSLMWTRMKTHFLTYGALTLVLTLSGAAFAQSNQPPSTEAPGNQPGKENPPDGQPMAAPMHRHHHHHHHHHHHMGHHSVGASGAGAAGGAGSEPG